MKYTDTNAFVIKNFGDFFNKNRKLIPCQRLRAIDLRKQGCTYREIASIMGVKSHRTIMFIVNPETLKNNMEKRKLREREYPEKYKMTKDKRNEYMRKHRKHKKVLNECMDLPIGPRER